MGDQNGKDGLSTKPSVICNAIVLLVSWTAFLGLLFGFNVHEARRGAEESALILARQSTQKDVLYRRWVARQGGVYAAAEQTPPNPYLAELPERDIVTPSGRRLTLVNPAYMTRQVFELEFPVAGIRSHLTSLTPLRPENAADQWESSALAAFERGQAEYHQIQLIDGQEYLRFMRPLRTEQACLACHASQGHKLDDISGGISVAVPMGPFSTAARDREVTVALILIILWLLGIAGVALIAVRLERQVRQRTLALRTSLSNWQASEHRYERVFENAPVMNFTLDPAGMVQAVNACGATQLGHSAEELVGRPMSELVHPEDQAFVEGHLKQLVEQPRQIRSWVARRVCKDGRLLWVRDNAQVLPGEDALLILIAGYDITEKKNREDIARARQRLLELASSHSLDEVLTATLDEVEALTDSRIGFYHYVAPDQRSITLMAWSTRTVRELCTTEAKDRHYDLEAAGVWANCIRERRTVIHNDYSALPDKTGFPPGHAPVIRELVVPIFRSNQIVAILGVGNRPTDYHDEHAKLVTVFADLAWDIAERKQAEEQVHLLNVELEQRVQDRTAQLMTKNESLKEFTYTVSHDLKAPLRGIAGYAKELENKHGAGLSERAQFCIAQILTAVHNLEQLIEDLLRYSHLEVEIPTFKEIDLRRLVDLLVQDRSLIIEQQQVELTVDLPFPALWTSEHELAQTLANLIDNALKYSREATPPRVRIWAEAPERTWRIAVSDNGIGFNPKYHDRIFMLFNRLVRAEDFEGTGAGLAIAKKLVDKLGGHIWAESTPGQGATFFIDLPKPEADALGGFLTCRPNEETK